MNNFEPRQGEKVLVSSTGDYFDVGWRVFVCRYKNGYLCEYDGNPDSYIIWQHAKPLPTKPVPIPYNHETWPKQVVWIKYANTPQHPAIVTGFTDIGIISGEFSYGFKRMKTENVISLDFCKTWQPCHYVPESDNEPV